MSPQAPCRLYNITARLYDDNNNETTVDVHGVVGRGTRAFPPVLSCPPSLLALPSPPPSSSTIGRTVHPLIILLSPEITITMTVKQGTTLNVCINVCTVSI